MYNVKDQGAVLMLEDTPNGIIVPVLSNTTTSCKPLSSESKVIVIFD